MLRLGLSESFVVHRCVEMSCIELLLKRLQPIKFAILSAFGQVCVCVCVSMTRSESLLSPWVHSQGSECASEMELRVCVSVCVYVFCLHERFLCAY